MSFNRIIVPSEGGTSGQLFADFLRVDGDDELEFTEMVKILYDRFYRLGMVRHTDGSRALRMRKREREAAKRRRNPSQPQATVRKTKAKARKTKAKARKTKTSNRRRRVKARPR
jgi:hypothetical protein